MTKQHTEITTIINRPIEEVFAYLTTPENNVYWVSGATEITKLAEGEIQVGATYRFVRTILGRKMEGTGTVIKIEPYYTFAYESTSGPFPFAMRYTLEPVAAGTQLHWRVEGEPGGFFNLVGPLLMRRIKKQYEADFQTLKGLLEQVD